MCVPVALPPRHCALEPNLSMLGCMESLVHYNRLLLRRHADQLDAEKRREVVAGCLSLLEQLAELDGFRAKRYEEIGECLFLYR